jgi:hypothetical protein
MKNQDVDALCPVCHHPYRFSDNEAGMCERIVEPNTICGHICSPPEDTHERSS